MPRRRASRAPKGSAMSDHADVSATIDAPSAEPDAAPVRLASVPKPRAPARSTAAIRKRVAERRAAWTDTRRAHLERVGCVSPRLEPFFALVADAFAAAFAAHELGSERLDLAALGRVAELTV